MVFNWKQWTYEQNITLYYITFRYQPHHVTKLSAHKRLRSSNVYEFALNALVIWPNYSTTWFHYPPADGFNPAIFEIASNASVTWPNYSSAQNSDLPNPEFELRSHELTTLLHHLTQLSVGKNFDRKMVAFALSMWTTRSKIKLHKNEASHYVIIELGGPDCNSTIHQHWTLYINPSNHNEQSNLIIEINSVFTRIWNTDRCTTRTRAYFYS